MNSEIIQMAQIDLNCNKKCGYMITPNHSGVTGIDHALSIIEKDASIENQALALVMIENTVSRETAVRVEEFLNTNKSFINKFISKRLYNVVARYYFNNNIVYRSYL